MSQKPVVTFDFDMTLKVTDTVCNENFVNLFRHLQDTCDVHIVTSRVNREDNVTDIQKFLSDKGLFAKSIRFSEHDVKVSILKEIGCQIHFDDDDIEIKACAENGILCLSSFVEDLWQVFLDHLDEEE